MFKFFKVRKTDPSERLRSVLRDYQLPSFPGAIMELMQRLRDPNASATRVAQALSFDPGLTMRVIKIANSPMFCHSSKIENLPQAVALIGISQIETLALSAAVNATLPTGSYPGYEPQRFWLAAVRRAVIARSFAATLNPSRQSEAFTIGFLQDMAIPFLAKQLPETYGPILESWHGGKRKLVELERNEFGWDHAEVATWICHEWDLPENIASAIGGHHGNDQGIYELPPSTALAAFLRESEISPGAEEIVHHAHEKHGISNEDARQVIMSSIQLSTEFTKLLF